MTLGEAVNRGYNMMVCAVLGLAGLALGSVIVAENDFNDKIDDSGLLLAGIVAVVWYLMGRHRFSRSIIPILLVSLALAAQVTGVIIEKDDKEAFGDNIGGTILYVLLLMLSIVQYMRNARHQAAAGAAAA